MQEVTPEYLEKLSDTIKYQTNKRIAFSEVDNMEEAATVIRHLNDLSDEAKTAIAEARGTTTDDLELELGKIKNWLRTQANKILQ